MPDERTPVAKTPDPAATDLEGESSRNGAEKRRDPNEPAVVVGLGASAGGVSVLQQFFDDMPGDSGIAFVVVMHLSPDFESQLASVLQQKTSMPVIQVSKPVRVRPNHVYVIPPNHQLAFDDGMLHLREPQQTRGRRVTIDLFFRTLAMAYGQRAVCVILSGSESDGVIGLKHIRAQGGVTIAQDPEEAEFKSMPQSAIATGMVDWVLKIGELPRKLTQLVANENAMRLPPEIVDAEQPDEKVPDAPGGETVSEETHDPDDESAMTAVLTHVRVQTGHDFSHYRRATILRRIARRLQVNSIASIPRYLEFLRTHPAETRALVHDLLIGVTHFFRDQDSFAALDSHLAQLFAGRKGDDEIRVWVVGCATGEEAYSIAMLLWEHAETLPARPKIVVFATDIDEQSVHVARQGVYPLAIEADVSPERLRAFFRLEENHYHLRKELRDSVIFAAHNVLSDAPFSRVDLITCRNLLIYLKRPAQEHVFDIFHFALRAGGLLFIGGAETADAANTLFTALDVRHRVYTRRSIPRPGWRTPELPLQTAAPGGTERTPRSSAMRVMSRMAVQGTTSGGAEESTFNRQERRSILFGELHLKLLEEYGPPSVVVNDAYNIVHLSEHAGRYLAFRAGEPSTNLITVIHPQLRVELRTALFRASQSNASVTVPDQHVDLESGNEVLNLHIRPVHASDTAHGFFVILFEKQTATQPLPTAKKQRETADRQLGDEVHRLKEQLNATVEQSEASKEELQASNEELQAMNEEMRSAAEELETSKEELQSVNEELTTVNHELQEKIEELSMVNGDLQNLIAATDIGTIFLDRGLRLQRYTPAALEIFNLQPNDLGRPLADITHKLQYPRLIDDAQLVLERLTPIEHEIFEGSGRHFLARIAPYRTPEDKINGVVLSFIDITALRRAEDALRASEKRLQLVLETEAVGVLFFDQTGTVLHANDVFLNLTGYTRAEVEGRQLTWQRMTPPEFYTESQHQLDKMAETGRIGPYEKQYLMADGTRRWMLFAGRDLGDGTISEFCIDITDRKEAEAEREASGQRYRTLFDLVPVAVYTTDADGRIEEFNHRTVELWGRTPKEKGAKYCASRRRFYSDGRPMAYDEYPIARVLRGEAVAPADCEVIMEMDDGTRKNVVVNPEVLKNEAGEIIGAVDCLHDITDRKHAEALLRESEERFRTVADNVPQLIWTNEGDGTANYFNRRWYEYSGLSYEESRGVGWQAIVHADDGPASVERWKRALAKGEVFDAEYRLRRKDGAYRWFIGRNVPLRHKGEVLSWFGTATDIEDLKQAEAALRESEERFRLLVEGAKDYAMFLLDVENQITFWSEGAERVLGWTEEEAIGQSGAIIFTEEDKAKGAVEHELATALSDGSALDRRWHLRKDRSRLWTDGIMMRLDDESGQLRGFAKIARDATEQQRADAALRHARDEMEQRVLERTRDLVTMNTELEQTMAQRQQLERELLEISEREKRRIGEDLHDLVCQELSATALYLKSNAKKLAKENSTASAALDEAAQTVNRNVGVARDLARGLQAVELNAAGLKNALRDLAAQACEATAIKCHFKCARGVRVPDDTAALHLYRVAQEAVTNAVKHSGAKNVLISLDRDSDHICVSVQDDGKGFVPRKRAKGLGLHMMRYRANALGGELKIERRRTGGMDITCVIPTRR
ncbi:MAG: two-component system, chemotaxis family, CheB/CheR fusion protein [Verrucomicrobiota bacterium]